MDFSLNDIQLMMKDSASKFIQKDYEFEKRRALVDSELGFSEENWRLFAELGWLALPVAEEDGGIGGDLVDMVVFQQELGKGLVVEPYFSTVVLGINLSQKLASPQQKLETLESVISGEKKLAFAHSEAHEAFDIRNTKTLAVKDGDKYILNGSKAVVLGGASADYLLVSARTSGHDGEENGLSLFVVNPNQSGVTVKGYRTNDGMRAAEVRFENVSLTSSDVLGEVDGAFDAMDLVLHEAIVALAAEAVGAMEVLLEKTAEYICTREQFGSAIGSFQALQHRMADMFMEAEQAKSMLYYAAIEMANGDANARKTVKMLKVKIGDASRYVGQQSVQLHGGMGVTDELDIGHYFKRLTCMNTLFGSRDYHLNELIKAA